MTEKERALFVVSELLSVAVNLAAEIEAMAADLEIRTAYAHAAVHGDLDAWCNASSVRGLPRNIQMLLWDLLSDHEFLGQEWSFTDADRYVFRGGDKVSGDGGVTWVTLQHPDDLEMVFINRVKGCPLTVK